MEFQAISNPFVQLAIWVNIFYSKNKSGFFTSMFSTSKVIDMDIDKAKLYCSELEITTSELLKVLDLSQVRLHALPESKFY